MRRVAIATLVLMAAIHAVPAVAMAGGKEKGAKGANPANAKATAGTENGNSVDLAALLGQEDTDKSFETFCASWMDKLRARERYNLDHIQWRPEGDGVVGEYVAYNTDHTHSVRNGDSPKSVPIGRVVYKEFRMKLAGKSEVDALASKPLMIEQTEVTELFRYQKTGSKGDWIY